MAKMEGARNDDDRIDFLGIEIMDGLLGILRLNDVLEIDLPIDAFVFGEFLHPFFVDGERRLIVIGFPG